jgi:hypothetical protein
MQWTSQESRKKPLDNDYIFHNARPCLLEHFSTVLGYAEYPSPGDGR